MSSTNRGNKVLNHDYYTTPIDRVVQFLKVFEEYEPQYKNYLILDPCAGGDTDHLMSYPEALSIMGMDKNKISTMDIRDDSLAEKKCNYLDEQIDGYDMIITNPPFYIAQEIIEKALKDVNDGGFVVMLLRLNFFGSKKRKELWSKHMPKYTFVHSERMSFTDDGKRDSVEYMHCVWQKGYNPKFAQLMVI